MPKRMVWIFTCSLCGIETDKQEETTPAELTIRGQTLSYDICEACEKDETGLAAFIEAGFREKAAGKKKPKAPSAAALAAPPPVIHQTVDGEVHQCPECSEVFPTPAGLAQHRSRIHEVVSRTAAIEATRGTGPLKCPECKAEGIDWGAAKPQGLGSHRRIQHGVEGIGGEEKRARQREWAAQRKKRSARK